MTDWAPLTVLIVEDEALLAMDIESMVEDSGHRVVAEAASLYDVQNLAVDLAPDIALIDVHLAHGTSGLDVCKLVRERWANAFVVFVTANPAKVRDSDCRHHGVIAKPFSRNGMVSAMRYIAEGVRSPPPTSPAPPSFVATASLAEAWAR